MTDESHTTNQTYSKAEWMDFCREWESSGEPQQQFCIRKGLSYNTFVYWRGKFTKQRNKSTDRKFTPVTINNDIPASSSALTINLPNGVSITRIKDKQTLSMLLTLLGIKPC